MHVGGQRGENRAEIEQFMLDAAQDREQRGEARVACFFAGNDGDSGEGVQFVDGAVGFDARGILGDALTSGETGLAGVASFGVDAVEGDAGVVKLFGHVLNGRRKKGREFPRRTDLPSRKDSLPDLTGDSGSPSLLFSTKAEARLDVAGVE